MMKQTHEALHTAVQVHIKVSACMHAVCALHTTKPIKRLTRRQLNLVALASIRAMLCLVPTGEICTCTSNS